ncbi:MAG: DUF4395 family protein [Candidatus Pacearchaeota archaeon]|jgi:hypothetical protein
MSDREKIAKRVYQESYKDLCDDKKRIVDTIIKAGGFTNERFFSISRYSLGFSKIIIAILYFLAIIFQIKEIALLGFVLILIAVTLKTEYNPFVLLFENTVEKLMKSKKDTYDRKAVIFANLLGAIFSFIALIFLYYINERIGFVILFFLALLKTASSFGFCGGIKIYNCMTTGCCVFKHKK